MEKRILKKLHDCEITILDEIVRICEKNNLKYYLMGGTLLGAVRHEGFIPWDDDLDIAMPRGDYEKFISLCDKELNDNFVLDDISTNDMYWLIFAKIRKKNTEFISKNENKNYKGEKGIWVDIFPVDYTNNINNFKINLKGKYVAAMKSIYFHKHNPKNAGRKKLVVTMFKPFSMKKMNSIIYRTITKENKKECKYCINYGSQYGVKKQTHLVEKIFPLKKLKFEGKLYNVPNDSDYVLKNIYGANYMKLPPVEKRVTHNPLRIVFEDGEEITFDEKI